MFQSFLVYVKTWMGNGYYIVHFRQLAIFSGLEISVFLYFLHRLSVNDVTNKMATFGVQYLMYELSHVCTAIIDTYDVPYDSEDAAYLAGYLMRQLVREVGEPCY
jgi:hypothetical protein